MASVRPSTLHAASVPITFVVANAFSYLLLLSAAHLLPAAEYGRLSSLLGVLLISSIPMLALQTVAARRVATETGPAGLVRATAQVGAAVTAALVAASPAVAAFLHLHSTGGVLLVAATVPAASVLGSAMGVAQGQRQFRRLAVLIAASTGGRSASGIVGLLAGRSAEAALIGMVAGLSVAAAVVAGTGTVTLTRYRGLLRDRTRTGVIGEAVGAAAGHGTFLLLTSLDVLLARHVLSSTAAGVYAVGSVLTRAALWLPQSIIALMFASLAAERDGRSARRASVVVLVIGVVFVLGAFLTGPLIVTVVGGAKYHQLDERMWLFGLLGALLAALQLALLAALAQRRVRSMLFVLWGAVIADLALVLNGPSPATPTKLVVTLVAVTSVAAAIGLWLTVRTPSGDRGAPNSPVGGLPAPL